MSCQTKVSFYLTNPLYYVYEKVDFFDWGTSYKRGIFVKRSCYGLFHGECRQKSGAAFSCLVGKSGTVRFHVIA